MCDMVSDEVIPEQRCELTKSEPCMSLRGGLSGQKATFSAKALG